MTHRASPDRPAQGDDPFAGTAYRMVARLGGEGTGGVFAVEHRELGRKFAAKLLRAEFTKVPRAMDRMRLEAQALGSLNHPNIISVFGFDTTPEGRPFIVTEYLQGPTLAAELRERGHLPVADAVAHAVELLSALEAAHQAGLVHRDVKPENLFLLEGRDGTRILKLTNFGLARVLPGAPPVAPAPLAEPTESGTVIGTPRFVSPEAALGERVDQRADLYGAALVLYAMLAGRGPFDHASGTDAALGAHVSERPEPPSTYAKEPVPAELDRLVQKALEKDPAARFQTAADFRRRLEIFAELLARPPGWLHTTAFDRSSIAARSGDKRTLSERPVPGLSLPTTALALMAVVAVFALAAALLFSALRGPR